MRKALFFVLAFTASDIANAGEAEFTMVASDGYQFAGQAQVPSAWSGTAIGVLNKSKLHVQINPFGDLNGKFRLKRAERVSGGVLVAPGPNARQPQLAFRKSPQPQTLTGHQTGPHGFKRASTLDLTVQEMAMERRLAAILAADVVGYSRLMAADEAATLARLQRLRAEVIEPKLSQFHGRIVGSAGDSLLVEFTSAVNAVECAIQMQASLAEQNNTLPEDSRMQFRMGVNLGDVIAEGGTIYGDGVNIAARLEKLAEPGGLCIGRSVYDQVKGKLTFTYTDLGAQRVHNIPDLIQAYRVQIIVTDLSPKPPLQLPDKPSIAVLPFENLSGDREQEYFADGMVEEIITALSRFRQLFVIARNSSFTYKGRAVDVKQVGRELGVRYVLEGSVRRAGNRVRITGQLIDTSTGAHLWADRFEGGLEDVFDLQDQVTASAVGAISPKLDQAEINRSRRKPTENLDAYDYYLRGLASLHQWTRESNEETLSNFYRAIELDPNFASAYGMAARTYVRRKAGGWIMDREREFAEAVRLARRAADLGKDDAIALGTAGYALSYIAGEHEEGKILTDRALVLNPNLAWGWLYSGWVRVWLGEPEAVAERAGRAMRLSPSDPDSFSMYCAMAFAHFFAGRYDEAVRWADQAATEKPDILYPIAVSAASNAQAERNEQAKRAMSQMRRIDPTLRMSNLKDLFPLQRAEDLDRWSDGLRRAGLPE
jgi:TolB-like protein/class 3 adenylate cyclase